MGYCYDAERGVRERESTCTHVLITGINTDNPGLRNRKKENPQEHNYKNIQDPQAKQALENSTRTANNYSQDMNAELQVK